MYFNCTVHSAVYAKDNYVNLLRCTANLKALLVRFCEIYLQTTTCFPGLNMSKTKYLAAYILVIVGLVLEKLKCFRKEVH